MSAWDVSAVTYMSYMFYYAIRFNQELSGWDVSGVTDMNSMFYAASAFDQNLSGWCVTNISSGPKGFATGSALTALNKPIWGQCALFDNNSGVNASSSGADEGCSAVSMPRSAPASPWLLAMMALMGLFVLRRRSDAATPRR